MSLDRVTIEEDEGATRIVINYSLEKVIKILVVIFILILPSITVPIFWYQMATEPEMIQVALPTVVIMLTCTVGGLLVWWFWSSHQQMMSITRQNRILEIVHAFTFLRFPRWYRLEDIFDVWKDAKRTEKPGDKYFLRMQSKAGERVKITRPSIRITKDDVERIYDALRPNIPLPLPMQRLVYFPHITVAESEAQTTITFRTRLHFISVRYYGILITLVGFLATPFIISIVSLLPEFLLYPGSAIIGLFLLLYLPFLLPWRKKHLVHNRNTATLRINHDRPTISVHNSVAGVDHDYPSILLNSIKHVPLSTRSELTFARHGTSEYTTFYTIYLDVGTPEEIFLYTTENDAEAEHVKQFLETLIPKSRTPTGDANLL